MLIDMYYDAGLEYDSLVKQCKLLRAKVKYWDEGEQELKEVEKKLKEYILVSKVVADLVAKLIPNPNTTESEIVSDHELPF